MKKNSKLEKNITPDFIEWAIPYVGPLLYSLRMVKNVNKVDDNFFVGVGYMPLLALASTIEMANLYAINQTIFPLLPQDLINTLEIFHF